MKSYESTMIFHTQYHVYFTQLFIAFETYKQAEKNGDDMKGIPSFWFQALTYHPATRELIQMEDCEALESLTRISTEVNEGGTFLLQIFKTLRTTSNHLSNNKLLQYQNITPSRLCSLSRKMNTSRTQSSLKII